MTIIAVLTFMKLAVVPSLQPYHSPESTFLSKTTCTRFSVSIKTPNTVAAPIYRVNCLICGGYKLLTGFLFTSAEEQRFDHCLIPFLI
ncbi:hypothetical protein ABE28_019630 [Peribacillus muralis]|uniref:Uncharacterized protein n=1 Tax=Peribacillus muralis TaxID=264697 RepID=A0A1B3XTS5_9BACI|nr:hypothetical protein [Peribacillus muralis]AOH56584.1 hypothetical protein ABE28_019630 [Peribacillus muralis]